MDSDERRKIIANGELDFLSVEEDAIADVMKELREKNDWAGLKDAEKDFETNQRKQREIEEELGITY